MATTINTQCNQQSVAVEVNLFSQTVSATPLLYIPNSLTTTMGFGEVTVKSQTGGNGLIQTFRCENEETKVSKVTLEVANTVENADLIQGLKSDLTNFSQGAEIKIVELSTGRVEVFPCMSLSNDPEFKFSEDSMVTLEFQGAPAIF